jgi:23S rRNA (cytidine1920-2'-O)/16S rRNA (cytidine1409-2'-O)-methyltransferase
VIEHLSAFFQAKGLILVGVLPSPILGPKGNREFFILLENQRPPAELGV